MFDVKRGDTNAEYKDHFFEISCSYHLGRAVVDTKTQVDPETSAPRIVTFIDPQGYERPVMEKDEATGKLAPIIAQFPIYSEEELRGKVGFDPDCPACRATAAHAYDHAHRRELSKELRRFEIEEDARREGLIP